MAAKRAQVLLAPFLEEAEGDDSSGLPAMRGGSSTCLGWSSELCHAK